MTGVQTCALPIYFHPTLSYIRRVLPVATVSPLRRDGETYSLDPAYPLTCDAWQVESAFEEARRSGEGAARRDSLERALALARLPFLEGCYDNWADEQQLRMRDRLERAHLDLGAILAAEGEFEAALANFRRAAELDAYRETTRAAIIECLVRLGNRRAALVEWYRLQRQLRDELAVEPLSETTARVARALGPEAATGFVDNGQTDEPQRLVVMSQAGLKAQGAD